MKFSKSIITLTTLTALLICVIYTTAFTIKLYSIIHHIYEDTKESQVYWRTSPPGTIFPWPTEPGPLEALSNMSYIDTLAYKYLVKSQALILITAITYIATIYYIIMKLRSHFSH